jgi:thioredoxin 1
MIEVLKFSATWCGPCRVLSSILNGVEGITNIDIDQEKDLAIEHNVKSVPTLIFLKDGKQVERTTGVITLNKYNDIINNLKNQ